MTTIAYPLIVLRMTGLPFAAGCVAFAAMAPGILVYMPAGALVDRWDPWHAMLATEFCRGIAVAAVVFTLMCGWFNLPLLIAAAIIEGVLEVFSGLAERRYVGSLVGRDQASAALVRLEARTHVAVVAGRPLGGLLFGIWPIAPFLADVASFFYSVTNLIIIRDSRSNYKRRTAGLKLPSMAILKNDIVQGLHWIYGDKFARRAIISFSGGTLIFQALIMVFLSFAHTQRLSAPAIGIVLAASGVGGALGSAAASRMLVQFDRSWITIQTSVWGIGFFFLAFMAARYFFFVALIMAILGFTGALGNIALDTHIMQRADKEMLARVTSIGRLVTLTACATGPLIGGILVQEYGVQRAMLYLFSIFFITPVLSLISATVPRAYRRRENSGASQKPAVPEDTILVRQF